MKKILNVEQTRAADQYSIQKKWKTSIELMENAAQSFVHSFVKNTNSNAKIIIVCGIGNNGGDGFAVCRLLREKGMNCNVALVKIKDELSEDCTVNKNRINDVLEIENQDSIPDFSTYDIIIDAIFGSGLNSNLKGIAANTVHAINNSNKIIYSIDIPSGLFADSISTGEYIIQNSHVISFQRPKLAFFLPENGSFIKTWQVVNIGLDEGYIQSQSSDYYVLDEQIIQQVIPRPRQSHKGTYGHALLMAGSYGKMGAAVLSTKSCLRSGAGLVTTQVPTCGYEILQFSAPEAMCLTDKSTDILTTLPDLSPYNAIGIGPGIGQNENTKNLLEDLLKKSQHPLIMDADAINILAADNEMLSLIPTGTILTPHIKEFDRLLGPSKNSMERFEKQRDFSIQYECIIVLKDANTCISSVAGELYFNTSGNQGMATGGSGDVLTGIITGLVAQKYDPLTAALIGVYFHGKAGDSAAQLKGYNALIASDIITHLKIDAMA